MATCVDCGRLCGTRHTVGWRPDSGYLCPKCASKRQSNAFKVILGVIFLAFAAILSSIVVMTVIKPIVGAQGFDFGRNIALGIGVGGIVIYVLTRFATNRISGCFFRMLLKFVGFVFYALGVGLLIIIFLLSGEFKDMVGAAPSNEAPPAPTQQPAPTQR